MSKQQIIEQIELWVRQGKLSFDDLQTLSGQAHAKEAAQDEQEICRALRRRPLTLITKKLTAI